MATYLILNVIFMAVVIWLLGLRAYHPRLLVLAILAVLLSLTIIFDNVIIGLHIVDYNVTRILGLKIGLAPLEDFMYPLLAAFLVPALWFHFHGEEKSND